MRAMFSLLTSLQTARHLFKGIPLRLQIAVAAARITNRRPDAGPTLRTASDAALDRTS